MRKMLTGLTLAALAPALAGAEPIEALRPMAFLAGHCWKGAFADGKRTDEHCFEWMYDGKFLRDRHVVRTPGRPDYGGESIYYWDSETRQINYLYLENLGGLSRGTAEAAADGLVFPPARYVEGGQALTYRSRWTRLDPATYEAHNEIQGKDGWVTAFKLRMQLQPDKN